MVFSPTAENFGVSAQIGSGVVRGAHEVRFHQGSTRVPPGFHQGSTRVPRGEVLEGSGRVGCCWGYRLSLFFCWGGQQNEGFAFWFRFPTKDRQRRAIRAACIGAGQVYLLEVPVTCINENGGTASAAASSGPRKERKKRKGRVLFEAKSNLLF